MSGARTPSGTKAEQVVQHHSLKLTDAQKLTQQSAMAGVTDVDTDDPKPKMEEESDDDGEVSEVLFLSEDEEEKEEVGQGDGYGAGHGVLVSAGNVQDENLPPFQPAAPNENNPQSHGYGAGHGVFNTFVTPEELGLGENEFTGAFEKAYKTPLSIYDAMDVLDELLETVLQDLEGWVAKHGPTWGSPSTGKKDKRVRFNFPQLRQWTWIITAFENVEALPPSICYRRDDLRKKIRYLHKTLKQYHQEDAKKVNDTFKSFGGRSNKRCENVTKVFIDKIGGKARNKVSVDNWAWGSGPRPMMNYQALLRETFGVTANDRRENLTSFLEDVQTGNNPFASTADMGGFLYHQRTENTNLVFKIMDALKREGPVLEFLRKNGLNAEDVIDPDTKYILKKDTRGPELIHAWELRNGKEMPLENGGASGAQVLLENGGVG